MITLSKQGKEGSTYVVEVRFKDEEGNAAAPKSLSWWLSDTEGNPVNNREDIAVTSPASVMNIVLTGNDLTPGWKIFTIKGTYDSDNGDNLSLRDAVKFYVEDLIEEDL